MKMFHDTPDGMEPAMLVLYNTGLFLSVVSMILDIWWMIELDVPYGFVRLLLDIAMLGLLDNLAGV